MVAAAVVAAAVRGWDSGNSSLIAAQEPSAYYVAIGPCTCSYQRRPGAGSPPRRSSSLVGWPGCLFSVSLAIDGTISSPSNCLNSAWHFLLSLRTTVSSSTPHWPVLPPLLPVSLRRGTTVSSSAPHPPVLHHPALLCIIYARPRRNGRTDRRSVGRSVGQSVGRSVGRSIGRPV